MNYIFYIAITATIYAILTSGVNVISGKCGQMSLCSAAFFALGGYATAILTKDCSLSWWIALLVSEACVVGLAYVLSQVLFRVPKDQFVMLSLLLNIAVYYALARPDGLTGGAMGIVGIPPIRLGHLAPVSPAAYLQTVLLFYLAVHVLLRRVFRAPFARSLQAIREDETFACIAGKNVLWQKSHAFALMAVLSVLAGSLYVPYISYVDPNIATLGESILILSMMIIGGSGSLWGPFAGAVVLVVLPELLRFVGIPFTVAANIRQILYGLALVGCMLWRPQGLIGEYAFGREPKSK